MVLIVHVFRCPKLIPKDMFLLDENESSDAIIQSSSCRSRVSNLVDGEGEFMLRRSCQKMVELFVTL
jgi:hypothetical protein